MTIIAIYSPKGGVGKTTISTDLAWRSAAIGKKRTLLWDFDTEGGSGFLYSADPSQNLRSSRVLEKSSTVLNHVQPTAHERLSYLGISSELKDFASSLRRFGPNMRLPEVLSYTADAFDRLYLDCPPVRNELSEQIMAAADLMLVPLPVSPLAARALNHVRNDLSLSKRNDLPILPVFSMFDSRRRAHRTAREEWMKTFPAIPYSTFIEQVAFRRRPIHQFAPNAKASLALDALWRGVEKRIMQDSAKAGRQAEERSSSRSVFERFSGFASGQPIRRAANTPN